MQPIIAGALLGGLAGGLAMALQPIVRPRRRSEWLDCFATWAGPASPTANQRAERAEAAVKQALDNSFQLLDREIRILGQGSTINNTNVKNQADIDLVVLDERAIWNVPAPGEEIPANERGAVQITAAHPQFASTILSILEASFPTSVTRRKKCIRIEGNDYRAECDILPAFRATWDRPRHQWASFGRTFAHGVVFVDTAGIYHMSFPEQHLANGRAKNLRTGYRYKQVVRVLKKLRGDWKERTGILAPDMPSSFEIECLVYNVPDPVLTNGDVFDAVYGSLDFISRALGSSNTSNQFSEVSRVRCLFTPWQNDLVIPPPGIARCREFTRKLQAAITAAPT